MLFRSSPWEADSAVHRDLSRACHNRFAEWKTWHRYLVDSSASAPSDFLPNKVEKARVNYFRAANLYRQSVWGPPFETITDPLLRTVDEIAKMISTRQN